MRDAAIPGGFTAAQGTVKNAFLRCITTIGDRLRARSEAGRPVEARNARDVFNHMTDLVRPQSVAIGA
jgi:hypothetical protein